jgi:hypothetical protein
VLCCAEIIGGLSSTLRHEVVMYLYKDAVEKVPFFRGKHPQFIAAVVTQLKLEYYSPVSIMRGLPFNLHCAVRDGNSVILAALISIELGVAGRMLL